MTTDYQYDSGGRLVTLTAYDAKGTQRRAGGDQVPVHLADRRLAANGRGRSRLDRRALAERHHARLDDHHRHATIRTTTYDLAGETLTSTDQRGVTHAYTYDTAGQQTSDAVTASARAAR